jgi:hypothetical protein
LPLRARLEAPDSPKIPKSHRRLDGWEALRACLYPAFLFAVSGQE